MPEIRYYTVTQEREVKVAANSTIEAAQIADKLFKDETYTGDAKVMKSIRDRDLVVREDY